MRFRCLQRNAQKVGLLQRNQRRICGGQRIAVGVATARSIEGRGDGLALAQKLTPPFGHAQVFIVPAQSQRGSIEMVTIDPAALKAALDRDAAVDNGDDHGQP